MKRLILSEITHVIERVDTVIQRCVKPLLIYNVYEQMESQWISLLRFALSK